MKYINNSFYRRWKELEEFNEKIFRQSIDISVGKMHELLNGKVDKRDLVLFQFSTDKDLKNIGIKAIFLGNYVEWHTKHLIDIIKKEFG